MRLGEHMAWSLIATKGPGMFAVTVFPSAENVTVNGTLAQSIALALGARPIPTGGRRLDAPYRRRRVAAPKIETTYSSVRRVASRSRSYRLVSGNGGNQDSRRTIQLS